MSGDQGMGNRIEDKTELVEHAEGDGDDGFAGGEFEELAAVAGEDFYSAATPFNSFDGAGELDAGASFADLSSEELGQAIVAFAYAEDLVAVNFFFSVLLDGEGVDPDLAVVGGIEALDVVDDLFALFRRKLFEGWVVGEGEVGTFPFLELVEEFEDTALLVALSELAAFVAVIHTIDRVCIQAGFADEVPELRRVAVDEFGSELEDLVAFAHGVDSASDAVAGFEDQHLATGLGKAASSGKAGHTGTDDQDPLTGGFHQGIGCGPAMEVIENRGHRWRGNAI